MKRLCSQVGTLVVALALALPASGGLIDFEDLPDGAAVMTEYESIGLEFAHATVITAGFSLNEFEFPPASGAKVVFDDGGALEILFADPVVSVAGYFTYAVRLALSAFDGADNPVASATSLFGANLGLSGDAGSSPNELLQVASAGGIRRVVIAGDAGGASFTLDDLMFTSLQTNAVPEPPVLALLAAGVLGFARRRAIAPG